MIPLLLCFFGPCVPYVLSRKRRALDPGWPQMQFEQKSGVNGNKARAFSICLPSHPIFHLPSSIFHFPLSTPHFFLSPHFQIPQQFL
jgi:hypothetical protein